MACSAIAKACGDTLVLQKQPADRIINVLYLDESIAITNSFTISYEVANQYRLDHRAQRWVFASLFIQIVLVPRFAMGAQMRFAFYA